MKKAFVAATILLASIIPANAILLDMGIPEKPFSIGARVGVNTTNISNNFAESMRDCDWTSTKWGTGFTLGAVADLRFKNYFSVQPGFFFQSRNMEYRNEITVTSLDNLGNPIDDINIQNGHVRSYNFNVPIMFCLKLKLMPILEGSAEVGPYFQWGFGGNNKGKFKDGANINRFKDDLYGSDGAMRPFDWGFKMGLGFTFAGSYYLGIHYMAGCRNIYKQQKSYVHDITGHNKCWDITLGYTIF